MPPSLAELLRRQRDVATRVQLVSAGVTRPEVLAHHAARRWRVVNDHVVVAHNGPLTREQQQWATLLSAQEPSALCGVTALEVFGLSGFRDEKLHVVVQRGAKVLRVPSVAVHVHESRRFSADDVITLGSLRLTSLSEVAFLKWCAKHGFPRPALQHRLDSQERRRYLDATFTRRDGSVFHVEIDGGVHLLLTVRWNDTRKDNDSALDGHLVLRFPSIAIYTGDPDAVSQIRRALNLSDPR